MIPPPPGLFGFASGAVVKDIEVDVRVLFGPGERLFGELDRVDLTAGNGITQLQRGWRKAWHKKDSMIGRPDTAGYGVRLLSDCLTLSMASMIRSRS